MIRLANNGFSKVLFVAILSSLFLLTFFVSIQFHRGGTGDSAKIAVTEKRESVSYSDLPLPVYDLETLSLANRLSPVSTKATLPAFTICCLVSLRFCIRAMMFLSRP